MNFQIDLNLPAYNTLNFVGEAIAVSGGSKGLYIYRFTLDEFVVLDRHSTYDIPMGCKVTLDEDKITLRDHSDCSNSTWLMLEDDDILLALSRFTDKRFNFYNADARKAIREEVQRRNLQLPSRSASSDGQGVEANSASDRPPSY